MFEFVTLVPRNICVQGHPVPPSDNDTWCPQCGEAVTADCDECGALFAVEDVAGRPIPAYCSACGYPYIWTNEILHRAGLRIALMDELTPAQQAQLARRIEDVVRDNVVAETAAEIVYRLLPAVDPAKCAELGELLAPILPILWREVLWPTSDDDGE